MERVHGGCVEGAVGRKWRCFVVVGEGSLVGSERGVEGVVRSLLGCGGAWCVAGKN